MFLPKWPSPLPLPKVILLFLLIFGGARKNKAGSDEDEVVKLLLGTSNTPNKDQVQRGAETDRQGITVSKSAMETLYPNAKKGMAYLNIPYAVPPTGYFRNTRPRPIEENAPIYPNTTDFAAFCPQSTTPSTNRWLSAGMNMSEDCLLLNIYTPKGDGPHPVYVHLHGGFLSHGSTADYGQLGVLENLVVRHRIVVVTVQYRLGPYGFLNFRDEERPKRTLMHNLGLEDQRMALEWVQANIHHYGGDPKRVILGGDGAGACSAAYHAFMADEEQLFRGVILMSATLEVCRDAAGAKHSVSRKFLLDACPEEYYALDDLNATVSKASRLADCLNALPMEEMVRKEIGAGMWEIGVSDDDAGLSVNTGAKKPLNVLMGVARDAWLHYDDELRRQSAEFSEELAKQPEHYLATVFHYLYPELDNVNQVINKTVELYNEVFGTGQPSTPAEWKRLYVKIMTDTMLTSSILSDAEHFQRLGHSVTLYKFAHEGPFYQREDEIGPVVPDSAETAYLFMPEWLWVPFLNGSSSANQVNISKEIGVVKKMADIWAEFIYADGVVGPEFGPLVNDSTSASFNSSLYAFENGQNGGQGGQSRPLNSYYLELGGDNTGYVLHPLLDERLI